MDTFERKVLDYIEKNKMFEGVSCCVCGVSGGADSVSLLTVLAKHRMELGIDIQVVHINHMIRGEAADSDERYVEELCRKYGVGCDARSVDVQAFAADKGLTVEEAGRRVRYEAFEERRRSWGSGKCVIAVAHNRNDVAETVMFNMARGTGMGGVKGIVPVRDGIVRPLLACDRREIEEYLDRQGIAYCTDATNSDDDYTRNKIRHKVLPAMCDVNGQAIAHICSMAELAADYEELAMSLVRKFLSGQGIDTEKLSCGWDAEQNNSGAEVGYSVDIESLMGENRLVRELAIRQLIGMVCGGLKDVGRSHVNEVVKLLKAESGAGANLPYGAAVRRQYGRLIFESVGYIRRCADENISQENLAADIDMHGDGVYYVPHGRVMVSFYDRPDDLDISKKEYTKCIDYDKIKQCLQLRTYRDGDYMIVNSSGARKKLNRLFTDSKVPQPERRDVLLVSSGSEIVWAVGIRIGENYKVTEDTKRIAELCFVADE